MHESGKRWTQLVALVVTSLAIGGCDESSVVPESADAALSDAALSDAATASVQVSAPRPDAGDAAPFTSDGATPSSEVPSNTEDPYVVLPPDSGNASSASPEPTTIPLDAASEDASSFDAASADAADTGVDASSAPWPDAAPDAELPPTGCGVQFEALFDDLELTVSEDLDANCSNEIQLNVVVTTNLNDGARADLTIDSASPVRATAADGEFVFWGVTFPHSGVSQASVAVVGDATCVAAVTLQGACLTAPACAITLPVLSAEKPALNGVAAPLGDNLNPGGPMVAQFIVSTDLPNSSTVLLTIDDGAWPEEALVNNGVADFASVALGADGQHTVVATCIGEASSDSPLMIVSVDTEPPTLVTSSITPIDNQHYAPQDDVDGASDGLQFDVCVPIASSDALDLYGAAANNVCVAIGVQIPTCALGTSNNSALSGQPGACVRMNCPGSTSFDLDVTVKDAAGNPALHTITGVTCG